MRGLDAALYCEILSEDFLNTLEEYGLKKEDIIFQQDNDPCCIKKRWKQRSKNSARTF
jgi:hypothetical protein